MKAIQDSDVEDLSTPVKLLKFPELKKLAHLISKHLRREKFGPFMTSFNITRVTNAILAILIKI